MSPGEEGSLGNGESSKAHRQPGEAGAGSALGESRMHARTLNCFSGQDIGGLSTQVMGRGNRDLS